jgi:hypothetical protein
MAEPKADELAQSLDVAAWSDPDRHRSRGRVDELALTGVRVHIDAID